MYTPSAFEESRIDVLHALVRAHPLGLLITHGAQGLQANPLPFLLDTAPAPFGTLVGHVARANPLWHDAGADVLVVFQGPQAYVSPNWYASKAEHGKVVPTWNYALVQGRGTLRAIDDAGAVRDVVTRLTHTHEARQARPWSVHDAPADFTATLLRAIVRIEVPLVSLTGKWKLSQNRPAADRAGVIGGLQRSDHAAAHDVARWMAGLD